MIKRVRKPVPEDQEVTAFCHAVGARLVEIRENTGLSFSDAAEAAGMSRAYLYELECGAANFTLKTLFRMAKVLGVEPKDIIPSSSDEAFSPSTIRFVLDRLDRIQMLLKQREEKEADRDKLNEVLVEELKSFTELPRLLDHLTELTRQGTKPAKADRKSGRS